MKRIDPHFTFILQGGIGNQLFQFFAGKYFSVNSGIPVKFDVTGLATKKMHENSDIRDFKFTSFDKFCYPPNFTKFRRTLDKGEFYLSRRLPEYGAFRNIIAINQVNYSSNPKITSGDKVIGYFQCSRYFINYQNLFGEIDWMASSLIDLTHESLNEISLAKNVVVHVRGGDFLSTQNSNLNLNRVYYEKALESLNLSENAKIFVFTDDFNHAELLLRGIPNLVFVNQKGLRASQVLLFMSRAKNLIISNSTLSYWAGIASNSRVVAPNRWLIDTPEVIDLYPSNWNIIRSD